jgi:hypothetical protein
MGRNFIAQELRRWVRGVGAAPLYIEPGSPGRMATAKVSTACCAMNALTARSSIRCAKPKSSSNNGEQSTTPGDHTLPLAIVRPRIRELREAAPKAYETIKTLDDQCADIYRRHPFYKPPDLGQPCGS